jgi:hypothetical protein
VSARYCWNVLANVNVEFEELTHGNL